MIFPGSLACEAGLKVGDRVVAVDGQPFRFSTIQYKCRGIPGTRVKFLLSDGRELQITRVDSRVLAQTQDPYYCSLQRGTP